MQVKERGGEFRDAVCLRSLSANPQGQSWRQECNCHNENPEISVTRIVVAEYSVDPGALGKDQKSLERDGQEHP